MLISIIMPVFNGIPFIKETLESVIHQSYQNFELIVINDGSTDGTLDLLKSYKRRLRDKLVILNQHNQGQVVAKNRGLRLAKGNFVAFLDSDDIWDKDKLGLQKSFFRDNKNIGMCYTEAILIDENSCILGHRKIDKRYQGKCFETLIMRNNITASSVMIKTQCIEKVGVYDERLQTCENWDLWLRVSRLFDIGFIEKPLTFYRIHKSHMSRNTSKMRDGKIKVIKKHLGGKSPDKEKECLFCAYLEFARDNLWNLNLKEARINLRYAIKLNPMTFELYKLYAKTFLPKIVLRQLRHINRRRDA